MQTEVQLLFNLYEEQSRIDTSLTKRLLKYILLSVAIPFSLLMLLAISFYLPPVQNWAVHRVCSYVSEKTGLDIRIGYVHLAFPLDLALEDVSCIDNNDTIIKFQRAVIDIQILPLLQSNVKINEMEFCAVTLNTSDYIPEVRVKGDIARLAIYNGNPVGKIDIRHSHALLSSILLDEACLDIALSDTVKEDTTSTENQWIIKVDNVTVKNSAFVVNLPGDTVTVSSRIGKLDINQGYFDIGKGVYDIASIYTSECSLAYDNKSIVPKAFGVDFNHLGMNNLQLKIDSLHYCSNSLSLSVRHCSFKERSGFDLNSLTANVALDSATLSITGSMATPVSKLYTNMAMDLNAFEDSNSGHFRANIDASLGKSDLMLIAGDISSKVKRAWPAYPLNIKGEVMGNMQEVVIPNFSIEIPTAFSIDLKGHIGGFMQLAENPYDADFNTDIQADIRTFNLSFAKTLLDKNTARMINLPQIRSSVNLSARGPQYFIKLDAQEGRGKIVGQTKLNIASMDYDAEIYANGLQLHHFIKNMGLGAFSGNIKASGHGFDYTDRTTRLKANAKINHLRYGNYNLDNIVANAGISNGKGNLRLNAANNLLDGKIDLTALLHSKNIKTTLTTDLNHIDLYKFGIVDVPLRFSLCGHVDIETDLNEFYHVDGIISDIRVTDSVGSHHLDDIVLNVLTRRDTTVAHIFCGDFETKLNAQGGYKWLLGCTERMTDAIAQQMSTRTIDQATLRKVLPCMNLVLKCGRNNPIYNSVKYWGIDFNDISAEVNTSREDGINGNLYLYGLKNHDYKIDTIAVNIVSSNEPLDIKYEARIQNVKPNDYVFNVLLNGHVLEHGLSVNGEFYDSNGVLGIKLGAEATMEEEGIKFHFTNTDPVIAYEQFSINKDNYILLNRNNRIFADLKMKTSDGTGLQVYSIDDDEDAKQDITLSLNRLNVGKLLSAIPYAPNVEGLLYGDIHFVQQNNGDFTVSTDMNMQNMVYEGSKIGNLGTQLVYMPMDDGSHHVDGHIFLEEEEIGTITGAYNFNSEEINAKLNFMHFPLDLVNGFIPDQIIGLEGFAEGELSLMGTSSQPLVNGELFLESASLLSVPYGIRMGFDDDPVRIQDSKLLFENFQMYAYNNEPLIAQGTLDFSDTEHLNLDLRMKAENFMLINAKENKHSEAYGKAYVNFYCSIRGELEKLKVRGKLDVLSSTNLYYILRDSPLTTDNRLKELVTFVDFSTGELIPVRPTINGMDVSLNITVKNGAHVKCWLNTDHSNYIDLIGGGDLRLNYVNDEINLRGRYTIHEGEMKYSLPVIPLKTFTISPDSYIEFSGDLMNPRLNITATERTKSSCSIDGVNRLVNFDCGVVITKTLNDMGLQFIIDAPEEQSISDQLAMMSTEERGKIAVTMLTTGMYLADGNTSNFSMNSALNSFLQSEINQIAGNALKTLDLSFGMDNSTEEDGTMHTDYTFKFAKRFWNNKLAISVGGKISSGPDVSGQNKSFFDNVEVQYRFSETSNQYANLFYKRSVYDYLEGYVGQYGAGYMYKKKLQHLGDLFRNTTPYPIQSRLVTPRDTTNSDSMVINNSKVNR